MVLLGLISGRSTATRLFGFSCVRRKICVMTWSPRAPTLPTLTVPACSLASGSGSTFSRPALSTTVKPRPRRAARYCSQASRTGMGCSLYTVITPFTRGSTRIWRSVMAAMARVTASMSALTKFTVTGVLPTRPPLRRAVLGLGAVWACTGTNAGSSARARVSGASLGKADNISLEDSGRGLRGVMGVIRSK